MKPRLLIAFLFSISLASAAHACSCAGSAPFLSVAPRSLVVHGVVRSYVTLAGHRAPHPVAMDVTVKRTLHGRYTAKTIRIIGDFGMSCVPYVINFPIGTEWVFAVGGPVSVPQLGDENFSFSPCSSSAAPVKKGVALEMTLDELAAKLGKP
jgi:hypothetical protein